MEGGVVAMMVKSVIIVKAKHPEPIFILGDWMLIEVRLEQQLKHSSPKMVTDEGMVIEVKPEQLEKQLSPKLVTDDGMVIEVKLLHPLYLLLVDYQYYTL